jgi:hypothetical protein
MTFNVNFGDLFASNSGLKYVAVSSDATSVWLYNNKRDLVIAQQTPVGWETTYVRTGSDGKVIYSLENKDNSQLGHDHVIRGPWVNYDNIDGVALRVAESYDPDQGKFRRFATVIDNGGFSIISPPEFSAKFENFEEVSLQFRANLALGKNFFIPDPNFYTVKPPVTEEISPHAMFHKPSEPVTSEETTPAEAQTEPEAGSPSENDSMVVGGFAITRRGFPT